MPWCPFAYPLPLKEPLSFRKGKNGDIQRIVVHHTGEPQGRPNFVHAKSAWNWWSSQAKAGHMVSAHFVIEPSGVVYQLVDTSDIAFGTATKCGHAVHIEHAGKGEPFTVQQLFASAFVIAWVKNANPGLSLDPAGTGLGKGEFGTSNQLGITCHAFSDLAAIAAKDPYAPKSAKTTCPGTPMMNSLGLLSSVAKNAGIWVTYMQSPEDLGRTTPP